MKKINKIFAVLVLSMLFLGGVSLLGYIFAFFVGGSQAEIICEFIKNKFYPIMIQITSLGIGFGLVSMYLSGESALSINNKKKG